MSTLRSLSAGLDAVSLDELNASAALLTRTDRKYVIPTAALAPVAADLTGVGHVRALELDGSRVGTYESTYFDTVDLAGWSASAHPRRRRWKVRTRVYADSDTCWLELKTRNGRGHTVKERLEHPLRMRATIGGGSAQWLGERFAAAGMAVRPDDLVTTLTTAYGRATWLVDGARITLDENLHFGCGERLVGAGDVVVVETKSAASGPGAVDRVLWRHGHRPIRISKYGAGMCVMHPELASNRWHRVLHRTLRPAAALTEVAA